MKIKFMIFNVLNVATRKCEVIYVTHIVSFGQHWTKGFHCSEHTVRISLYWTCLCCCHYVAETNFLRFCHTAMYISSNDSIILVHLPHAGEMSDFIS